MARVRRAAKGTRASDEHAIRRYRAWFNKGFLNLVLISGLTEVRRGSRMKQLRACQTIGESDWVKAGSVDSLYQRRVVAFGDDR